MLDDYQLTTEKEPLIERSEPMSVQVANVIRERITNEVYTPNDKLPSETDLSEWLGVSRGTIRTAMAALEAEGFITRKQGAGTFVNPRRAIEVKTITAWEFTRMIEESDREASIEVLSVDRRISTECEASLLKIDPDSEVISLKRIFLADGSPAIYSTNTFPAKLIKVTEYPDAFDMPIFDFLSKYCKQKYDYCTVDISSTLAERKIADALGIEEGVSILELNEIFYNCEGLILFIGINYFNDHVMPMRIVQNIQSS